MFGFYLIALLMTVSALGVLLLKNPLHSALCLILNLLGVAVLFAMLEAHFLAVVQVIVYAGAIMVLIMFALMLLNVKAEVPAPRSMLYLLGGLFFAGLFAAALLPLMATSVALSPGLSKIQGTVALMGQALFSRYLFPFELSSLLIVTAIVGAAITAQRVRASGKEGRDA